MKPKLIEVFTERVPFSWAQEISAGISVGLITLPLALALGIASIPSGTTTQLSPPAIGLLTAILASFLISSLGGSRVQIGGPTAAFIPIVVLIITQHGYSGLLIATMMAGSILILMGLAGMGRLIKFIPWPVTSGFTTGIALSIILSQLPDFAGISSEQPPPREFFEKIPWLLENFQHLSPYSLILSLACLAFIFLWPKLKIQWLPGSLVAMLLASVIVWLAGWNLSVGISTIGSKFGPSALAANFPSPSLPTINWELIRELISPATAIALLGAIESLLSAVVADGLTGHRHNSNTELVAQGIANLISPLFGGLPATGAIARTSANVNLGAKTPISGIVSSITLLTIILMAAPLASKIPIPAMAAVLMSIALRMGEWHELLRLHKMPRSDALVLLTTMSLTFVFDLVIAVEVGLVLAAILFIKRVADTTEITRVTSDDMLERPEQIAHGKTIPDGVLVFRIFGPFLFGAVEKMEDALATQRPWPKVLILQLHLVTAMDATGMNVLESIIERMRNHGGQVILSGTHQQPLQMMRKAGFIQLIGYENFCATFDDALKRANRILSVTPSSISPNK